MSRDQLTVDSRQGSENAKGKGEKEPNLGISMQDLTTALARNVVSLEFDEVQPSEVYTAVGYVKKRGKLFQIQMRAVLDESEWLDHTPAPPSKGESTETETED